MYLRHEAWKEIAQRRVVDIFSALGACGPTTTNSETNAWDDGGWRSRAKSAT